MNFGDNLKLIRKQRKISQEQLADKVGVSRQSVSKWETGEAYPEMNNILQLCKIFNCHINDLVHENMHDINSLDKEIKMSVVKFKKEQQKKMKGISKAIYIISSALKTICMIGVSLVIIAMIFVPFFIKKIEFGTNSILISGNEIGTINNIETLNKAKLIFENNSDLQLIIYAEFILICLGASIFIFRKLFHILEKLFKNIYNGDTPFTLENIDYIKNISKTLILGVIFPIVTGFIGEIMLNTDLGIEVGLMDVIIILIAFSLSYIFEYGYQIQNDSEGVMYDKK